MRRCWKSIFSLVVPVGLVSCGLGGEDAPTAGESATKTLALDEASGEAALTERFADYSGDVVTDGEGRILKDSKRSQFEGKQLTTIGGEWAGKEYVAKRYSVNEWGGTQRFQEKNYDGDLRSRYQDSEWFLKKQAGEAGEEARVGGQDFQTGRYDTGRAREGRSSLLGRPSDVETDVRREVYQPPLVIPKADYTEMTVEDTNRLLGR